MLPIIKILFLWIIGVLLIPLNPFELFENAFVLVIVALLFLLFNKLSVKSKYLGNCLSSLMVILVVQLLTINNSETLNKYLPENAEHTVVLQIIELYKQTEYQNKYIVRVEALVGDSLKYINHNYLLLQKRDSLSTVLLPGDRFKCKVFLSSFTAHKHEALFNAKKYWNQKGVHANLWLKKEPIICLEASGNVLFKIRKLQISWLNLIDKQNIKDETKQILAALLLGDKRGLSKDISNKFSKMGLVHTLALSGLHVSLIYGIFAFFLSFVLQHRQRLQSVVLVVIIIAYAILTGLSPSVMRASLMFLLYAFSLLINRRTTAINIVFLSALILLIYNSNLLFDVGFQLSYLAVIGIVYFYNKFKFYFKNHSSLVKFFFGLALVSISAQLSTGLLSVYYFHSFPLSFLWANLIVLPLITVLLYEGLLYLVLLIIGVNYSFIDWIIDKSTEFILLILAILELYSFAPIQLYISKISLVLSYGLLLLLCVVLLEKNYRYLKFLYVYLFCFVLYSMFGTNVTKRELFVNASSSAYVISVISNNEQVLVSDNYITASYLLGSYSLENNIICIDSLSIDSENLNEFSSLSNNNLKFFMHSLIFISNEKLNLKYRDSLDILFMHNYRNDVLKIQSIFSPNVVLLDASISNKNRILLMKQWQDLNVNVVDLKSEAFVRTY